MTPSTLDLAETIAAHEFDIPCAAEDGPATYIVWAKKSCGCESTVAGCEDHVAATMANFCTGRCVRSVRCGHFCTLDEIRVEPIRGGA